MNVITGAQNNNTIVFEHPAQPVVICNTDPLSSSSSSSYHLQISGDEDKNRIIIEKEVTQEECYWY